MQAELRGLPSVDELASRITGPYPRRLIVNEVRRAIAEARRAILDGGAGPASLESTVQSRLEALSRPTLRPVINATGVVLHTNLGRAPLPAFDLPARYSNLEYDLGTGGRGKRDVHVSDLLVTLIGAPGIVVNNNAAAVYLVLNELAGGGEVIISRGELIEIGDGFRIPEIMQRAGVIVREVGTTNRTRLEDYAGAITDRTRLIVRVHPSNFRIEGFTGRPTLAETAGLGVPVYEDVGSGCVVDLKDYGIDEPLAEESLAAGVSVVTFSGDKLLGGPQAGIIAGDDELIRRIRRNPMFRALRVDKLIYAALAETLRLLVLERWDEIPALYMIRQSPEAVRARAERVMSGISGASLVGGASVIGGGSTPQQSLDTWLIAVEAADVVAAERKCRSFDPPVIARIENDRLLFDLRTVFPDEEERLRAALQALS